MRKKKAVYVFSAQHRARLAAANTGKRHTEESRNKMRAASLGPPPVERFWAKVDKNGPVDPRIGTPCWIWTACRAGAHHYGRFMLGPGKPIAAHRYSWQLANGKVIPTGLLVCHRCDNPICVNPVHLFLGTTADNNRDTREKGRFGNQHQGKTQCKNGHRFDEANTYRRNGTRSCRACVRANGRAYYHRQKEKREPVR
jgi:hypothetical protein